MITRLFTVTETIKNLLDFRSIIFSLWCRRRFLEYKTLQKRRLKFRIRWGIFTDKCRNFLRTNEWQQLFDVHIGLYNLFFLCNYSHFWKCTTTYSFIIITNCQKCCHDMLADFSIIRTITVPGFYFLSVHRYFYIIIIRSLYGCSPFTGWGFFQFGNGICIIIRFPAHQYLIGDKILKIIQCNHMTNLILYISFLFIRFPIFMNHCHQWS